MSISQDRVGDFHAALLSGPKTSYELAEACQCSVGTAQNYLTALRSMKLCHIGSWVLHQSGNRQIQAARHHAGKGEDTERPDPNGRRAERFRREDRVLSAGRGCMAEVMEVWLRWERKALAEGRHRDFPFPRIGERHEPREQAGCCGISGTM